MNRKKIETAKVVFMGACTVLTLLEALYLHQSMTLLLTLFFAVCTAYFVWKRSVFIRLESGEAEPSTSSDPEPTTSPLTQENRLVTRAAGCQLAVSALVLAAEIAFFDRYSAAFIDAHGGTRAGVAIGLGVRALFAIGWGASYRMIVQMLGRGGDRAVGLATAWSIVSGVGFVITALRDITPWLVAADALRALIGLAVGAALVVPSFRRGVRGGTTNCGAV